MSVRAVLEHRTSSELGYYHAFYNVALFKQATVMSSETELNTLFHAVQQLALCDIAAARHPSILWKMRFVETSSSTLTNRWVLDL